MVIMCMLRYQVYIFHRTKKQFMNLYTNIMSKKYKKYPRKNIQKPRKQTSSKNIVVHHHYS